MSGGGFRVSEIPGNVRKMIQNIKEIAGNHAEEEIYAMLKECGMDPNETAQKLLLQDTFHEVKRKRDKKKENPNNRETVDSKWRSGPPGQVVRGGRGNYSAHYAADAAGGKKSVSGTENGVKQTLENAGSISPLPAAVEEKIEQTTSASSVNAVANCPIGVVSGGNVDQHTSQVSSIVSTKQIKVSPTEQSQPISEKSCMASGAGMSNEFGQARPSSSKTSVANAAMSGGCPLASDPVFVRSNKARPSGAIGSIKHDIGSQRSHAEPNSNTFAESRLNTAHEIRSSSTHAKSGSKSQTAGKNQHMEFSRPLSSSGRSGSSSRPSSNYGSRSQQVIGPPKGPNKEWKPKLTNSGNVQGTRNSAAPEQVLVGEKTGVQDLPLHNIASDSDKAASRIEKKLEALHINDGQHVIIPKHIQVPEAVKTGLSFGSFDAALEISSVHDNDSGSEKCSDHTSGKTQVVENSVAEQSVSNVNVLVHADEADSVDHPRSSTQVPENPSIDADVSSSVSDVNNSKETSGGPQHPVVHTSPPNNFGFVPPLVLGNLAPNDNSDTQASDSSAVSSFVVQQPIDPTSFYAQFYRPGEGAGRISPFPSPGVSTNYNGHVAMLPAHTSQLAQEGGNPAALSTAGIAPLATQAGVMPSSVSVTQQVVPAFRQPGGVHLPHYSLNYIPYGHYFPPYYVPPPAIHPFLGNNAFPQHAQAGSVYPGPPTGATAGVKYPVSQFKPGNNSGSSTGVGMTASYEPYGPGPAGYNAGSAAAAGNSSNNEDLSGSQFKEHNLYIAGQQSEGSAVWIAAPGREISGLQPNSFYNLPPQGQHVTFTPSQAGHGTFAGVYHPSQAVTAATVHPFLQQSQAMPGAVDIVGAAPANVYQPPQHAQQMNWPNNYRNGS